MIEPKGTISEEWFVRKTAGGEFANIMDARGYTVAKGLIPSVADHIVHLHNMDLGDRI